MVGDGDLEDHEQHAVLAREAREVDPRAVQQLAPGALHEGKILRVIDDATGVGVLVIDPDLNFQLSERRSRLLAGAASPKWRYAFSVATRPRGVRCRWPC